MNYIYRGSFAKENWGRVGREGEREGEREGKRI